MRKYGVSAINAIQHYHSGRSSSIVDAWEQAVADVFPDSRSSQLKGCPRGTFLGLCENGTVVGVPSGRYTKSQKNKLYGLRALELLYETPELADDKAALWRAVMGDQEKKPNHQMDVVVSLWKAGLIFTRR